MANYLDKFIAQDDLMTKGMSACKGCGAEMILRRVIRLAGPNTVMMIPPGCMAGSGVIGSEDKTGMKIPVTISLLDNPASMAAGVSRMYEHAGRPDVNVIAFAGDGATADAGFQALSGAAERGEKILYICYDNEGYMNTGYQRSSTTSYGSRTSTTPIGSVLKGKPQPSKFLPLIVMMHNPEYMATISPSNMPDMVNKIEKALEASKRGFAYLHAFSGCPTGWGYAENLAIHYSRGAVQSNLFPLMEYEYGKLILKKSSKKLPIAEYIKGVTKFKHFTQEMIDELQSEVDRRMALLEKLARD